MNTINPTNPITVIDDLIMELSLIKNGQHPSIDKFQKAQELIIFLLNQTKELKEDLSDSKLCFIQLQTKKKLSFTDTQLSEFKSELEKINNFLESNKNSLQTLKINEIDSIQELLLSISLPIWKEQISMLKPNQFKFIEL